MTSSHDAPQPISAQGPKRRLIVGCGYLGARLARRFLEQGDVIFGLSRRPERAGVSHENWHPLAGDVSQPETLPPLPEVETVVYAVSYRPGCGASREALYRNGPLAIAERLPQVPQVFAYLGSTGVYGDHGGRPVDEWAECRPLRASAAAMWAGEHALQASRVGERLLVFRLAGLYGPGRLPLVDRLRRGEPLPTDPDAMLNLVHVDDAARLIAAGCDRLTPPGVYNVADGRPVSRREFYSDLAERMGLPSPRFAPPERDAAAGRRAKGHLGAKRIVADKILRELGIALMYPNYQEALRRIVEAETA